MEANSQEKELSFRQQRVLKLLFKFRFISAQLLAQVMGISRPGTYQILETLVEKKLVTKVYEGRFRIDRKPAYYYLNKQGVTTVRKIMDVKESVVHTLYKNDAATPEFIEHCITVSYCYTILIRILPPDTSIYARPEINRWADFPKNRPDLYIRTPAGHEAIIVIADDSPLYITRKRLNEIITHSEDEGWEGGVYPHIGFILKSSNDKNSLLYTANKKLESMGMDEDEIHIVTADIQALAGESDRIWSNVFKPKSLIRLFE